MTFSLMTPSRGRPDRLEQMVKSARSTATRPQDIQVIVWLDQDDPALPQYRLIPDVEFLIGPRNIIHSARWDKCLPFAKGEYLYHVNDDVIHRTDGWDDMVLAEFAKFPDNILMVHGDDLGCQRENFGCHPCIHRKWVDTLGYFIPDCFDGEWGDSVVNLIANHIGRRRFLPFVCEHMHYLFGKGEIDDTTREYAARQAKQNPEKVFLERMQTWITDAEKLRKVMLT